MGSPENAFELALHQNFKQSLQDLGYVVCFDFFPDLAEGSKRRYTALVMPQEEYTERLNELNALSHNHWLAEFREAVRGGWGKADFVRCTDLPSILWEEDPRTCSSDSAWEALSSSAEIASQFADSAPAGMYFGLEDDFEELFGSSDGEQA